MKIETWYSDNFERLLAGRYIALNHINPLLENYKNSFEISTLGRSEKEKNISLIKIGQGNKKVFAWSQMHGNESTTTKSIFDFLKFVEQKEVFQDEIRTFLKNYTLYVIPMLNPDGASLYTRENAKSVDLNRDAQDLSQKESVVLMDTFNALQPDLCLNLHGQRTLFGLEKGQPATISFLSPASNKKRDITASRLKAMLLIEKMNNSLQKYIPGQVGRYDDSFNSNCFGDYFQKQGVPVILFEAGHYHKDYHREKSREFIFYSLLTLFGIVDSKNEDKNDQSYLAIPENKKNFRDVLIRNVRIKEEDIPFSIAIQYEEKLSNNNIRFVSVIDSIGVLDDIYGHLEIEGKGEIVLINSQNIVKIGEEISDIINKNGDSLINISEYGLIYNNNL